MGFKTATTGTSVTLTAKFTPIGRELLLSNTNNLITYFSVGDSDANYNATLPLLTGEVPTDGGDLGPDSSVSNSIHSNVDLTHKLKFNSVGATKKLVEPSSLIINSEIVKIGDTTISGSNLTHNFIDRVNLTTETLGNLFVPFGLPPTSNVADTNIFTGKTTGQGGYSDTSLSGMVADDILVIGFDNSQYGELVDGKTVKIDLESTNTAFTTTLYGTYMTSSSALSVQDANVKETSTRVNTIGDNMTYLFSDEIQKPNSATTATWATGYGTVKPFSVNGKERFNYKTILGTTTVGDKAVGAAYLDKGFAVIWEPDLVSNFTIATGGTSTATTVQYNSVATKVNQNVTCLLHSGEFASSTNPTWKTGDKPRISEVGLYDANGNLIAIAKTDQHIERTPIEFLALGIKISL